MKLLSLLSAFLASLPALISGTAATTHAQSRTSLPPNHPLHPRNQAHRSLQTSSFNDTQALREKLLTDYDRADFPFVQLWQEQNSTIRSGLPVEVGLNFHRVFKVDVMTSVADLIVWVRQQWRDPRLVWDPAEYNNIEIMHFWVGEGSGAGGEMSEIWTPDLQLWNLETPLSETQTDAHAVVTYDGTVFWSRPGHIKPVCKFQGLDNFPFDTLGCTIEIGSWSYSGLYMRPTKMDKGYSIGGSETAGEAFAEFSLVSVDCEEHIYPGYPPDPEADWPVLLYHVVFQRSWQPYARGYLFLQIVLNIVAFCSFWLPPHSGERIGLNITAMLAAVASELVVAANIPAASEMTWFAKFSLVSLCFSASALMESAAVIYFHYHTGDDLVPDWVRWIQHKLGKNEKVDDKLNPPKERTQPLSFPSMTIDPSASERVDDKLNPPKERTQPLSFSSMSIAPPSSSLPMEPPTAIPPRPAEDHNFSVTSKKSVTFGPDPNTILPPENGLGQQQLASEDLPTVGPDPNTIEICQGQQEHAAVGLPLNADGIEEASEEESGESFHEPTSEELAALKEGAAAKNAEVNRTLQRSAMDPALIKSFRTRKTVKTILGRDADDFKNAKEMENNLRWQKVARAIDDFSRVFFPLAFSIAVISVFANSERL